MVCFSKVFCPCFSRRRRAGSSRGGSSVIDRPSSERRLGNGQPEAREGGEPPREVELLNQNASEQPEAPRIGPQQDDVIMSFPRLDESPDGDNPSNDVSRQDPPQRDTGIAPRANVTQTDIGGPSNNVSQQGTPQHGTPKPRSRRESRSTAAGLYPPLTLRDLLDRSRSSPGGAPQANNTQTNAGSSSNDAESTSSSSDGANSTFSNDSESSSSSSDDDDSQENGCKPPDDVGRNSDSPDGGAPQVINTQTNVSNPSDNISQEGALKQGGPKPRSRRGSRSIAAGSIITCQDLLGGFLNSVSGSSDGAPRVINTQTNVSNPSDNISQEGALKQGGPKPRSITAGSIITCQDLLGGFLNSVSGSSDGARQANNTQKNRAQNSSGSQRGQDPIISERESHPGQSHDGNSGNVWI